MCHPNFSMEQREEMRSQHKSLILLEEIKSGKCSLGKVADYSISGMGLRSEKGLEPGTDLFIGIENSPYSTSHDIFRAQVVWCEELSAVSDFFCFAMGIKYC